MGIAKALGVASLMVVCSYALSAVPTEDAEKLRRELTPMGAERGSNAEGTVPEWDPLFGLSASGPVYMSNPLPEDRPLFIIANYNYRDYVDLLSPGVIALFDANPDYQLLVYRTLRTANPPRWLVENTLYNAANTELSSDGLTLINFKAGVPFPIPQSGQQVIWNHLMRWVGKQNELVSSAYHVDASGNWIESSRQQQKFISPLYRASGTVFNASGTSASSDMPDVYALRMDQLLPQKRKGEILLMRYQTDYSATAERKIWQYFPDQSQVRRVSNASFGNPLPDVQNSSTYDDMQLFSGSPEKYDWTLLGKQDCIVPYNNWAAVDASGPEQFLRSQFYNPELVRWEFHRCWLIEGRLRKGEEHVYPRRRFWIDEDTWNILLSENYNAKGQLWRHGQAIFAHAYQTQAFWSPITVMYDLQGKTYSVNGQPLPDSWSQLTELPSEDYFTPRALLQKIAPIR